MGNLIKEEDQKENSSPLAADPVNPLNEEKTTENTTTETKEQVEAVETGETEATTEKADTTAKNGEKEAEVDELNMAVIVVGETTIEMETEEMSTIVPSEEVESILTKMLMSISQKMMMRYSLIAVRQTISLFWTVLQQKVSAVRKLWKTF